MVRIAVALLMALAVTGSAVPAFAALLDPPGGPAFARSVLTDNGPRLRYWPGGNGRVVIGGDAGDTGYRDVNRREVFTQRSTPATGRQTTCATWLRQSDPAVQQGLAVRVRDDAGRVRAVTLTKNVQYRLYWAFNLVTWDTARSGDPWRKIGQFDLSSVVGQSVDPAALPWRICLRATGRHLAFKVWLPGEQARPTWDDDRYVRRARLPRGYAVGVPGWYVGHLPPDGQVAYGGLRTNPSR